MSLTFLPVAREAPMSMFVSRITSKGRTVIPKAVRERLRLKPGDFLRYVMEGRRIVIERVEAEDNAFATFREWASDADEEAYRSL
jgi:AbrB family looped-hinge helix DNA binding protein